MNDSMEGLSMEDLRMRTMDAESNMMRAAEFGQSLLTEKNELEVRIEEQIKLFEKRLETAEQEKYGLQVKFDQMTTQADWYSETITDLRNQLAGCEEAVRESLEADKQQKVSHLTRQLEDLQADLEQSQRNEQGMKQKIEELEQLLKEKLNRSVASPGKSFLADELGQLQDENNELQCENTTLKGQLIAQKAELQATVQEKDMIRGKLIGRDEALDEIKCQFSSVNSSLEQTRMEKLELRAQLDALRMEKGDHKKKGNSLFAELDDRRVDAEKKCLSQQMQLTSLKEKYEVEKQQNLKYKRQISQLLFHTSSGKVDQEHVSRLEQSLFQARQEIQELLEEKQRLQQREKQEAGVVEHFGEVDVRSQDHVQYLRTVIKSKEEELEKANQSLRVKKLQFLDEQRQGSSQASQMLELEGERDKLRSQNMKLAIKLEELRLKYDPDSLKKGGKLVVTKIEKIPLDEPEEVILTEYHQNSTINQSDASLQIDKSCNYSERVLPLAEKQIDNVPVVQCELKSSLSKKKTVSISKDVESYDEEKNCEIKELKETEQTEKLEKVTKSKSKGRVLPVKHVSGASSNKQECKQQ